MLISFLYPHRNRIDLFEKNLESLAAQTAPKDTFEIIIADHSSHDHWEELKRKITFFRNVGLQIRAYRFDPIRCQFAHQPHEYGGAFNPVVGHNICVKKAKGDVVVLSSPEVVNARTNVVKIQQLFADGQSKFVLGWIGDRSLQAVRDAVPHMVRTGITVELAKRLCIENSGYGTRCRPEDWKKENYFLGALKREDLLKVGGFEEKFLQGIAYEDNEFSERLELNGVKISFCGDIVGTHLSHSRGYQGDIVSGVNHSIYKELRGQKIANVGREWGCDDYVIEVFE